MTSQGIFPLWLLLFAIWIAAAGASLEPASLAAGVALALGIAIAVARHSNIWRDVRLCPRRAFALLRYAAVFVREIIRSNLKLLAYIYAPRLRLAPGIIPVRTKLATPLGRLALTSTITLTPGTLAIDLSGETFLIHVLDLTTTDTEEATAEITGAFEPHLARAFG
ncbi:Na+/H+ antiporter subunit E [Dichotomicrobium thermohalophilum]|uniref:Multicomponent Na+:H+ antiporter subunit E n=1 Tax=Dichotomicrobium thermohalophilum TaxID=933063 RepID=A0A397QBV0_9HYPH|nr:Na+/H+ antiporter subunit E [Dichotomicrobium thermohalophilum]RIA55711.1 multicomponent Na+:H+ antiporter subunit E [Dichotomicrobium thermohalophilum]